MVQPPLIRSLREDDAGAARALRLRALREAPVPFLGSYDEEVNRSVEEFASGFVEMIRPTKPLARFETASW
jgi:hypothetical protein